MDSFADVDEDGDAFASCDIGEVFAAPIIVSNGVVAQLVLHDDGALRDFSDAENHPTSLADVKSGLEHGGQTARSRIYHVEEKRRVFSVGRFHG